MTVIPFPKKNYKKPDFLPKDINKIVELSYFLYHKGKSGIATSLVVDDVQLVSILTIDNDDLLLTFEKDESGYYSFDSDGEEIAHAENIEDLLSVIKNILS